MLTGSNIGKTAKRHVGDWIIPLQESLNPHAKPSDKRFMR